MKAKDPRSRILCVYTHRFIHPAKRNHGSAARAGPGRTCTARPEWFRPDRQARSTSGGHHQYRLTNQPRAVITTAVKLTFIAAFQAVFLKSKRAWYLGPSRASQRRSFYLNQPCTPSAIYCFGSTTDPLIMENGLRYLAIQIYSRMGYRILNREDN